MKKKIWIPIAGVAILLAVLFVPIPQGTYDDGGTREWTALTYKIVKWNKLTADVGGESQIYRKTRVYFGGDRYKSIDELWRIEAKTGDYRTLDYTGEWLDRETAEYTAVTGTGDFVITDIYKNCFFVSHVIPLPQTVKINGSLDDKWCVGDQVYVTYEKTYSDSEKFRMECDLIQIEESTFKLDPYACYKPVIYLYPEKETEVSVRLTLDGGLSCTYPAYKDGWTVTASPNGTLTDKNGQTYNYLYWEGETYVQWDMSQGYCVKGEDTAAFLEDALAKLGLNRREANEFIVYWLPLMQENEYNIISFQTDVYTDSAKLEVTPEPDTIIRVFMSYKASDTVVKIEAQTLSSPERTGFTVIEWGGTEIK